MFPRGPPWLERKQSRRCGAQRCVHDAARRWQRRDAAARIALERKTYKRNRKPAMECGKKARNLRGRRCWHARAYHDAVLQCEHTPATVFVLRFGRHLEFSFTRNRNRPPRSGLLFGLVAETFFRVRTFNSNTANALRCFRVNRRMRGSACSSRPTEPATGRLSRRVCPTDRARAVACGGATS